MSWDVLEALPETQKSKGIKRMVGSANGNRTCIGSVQAGQSGSKSLSLRSGGSPRSAQRQLRIPDVPARCQREYEAMAEGMLRFQRVRGPSTNYNTHERLCCGRCHYQPIMTGPSKASSRRSKRSKDHIERPLMHFAAWRSPQERRDSDNPQAVLRGHARQNARVAKTPLGRSPGRTGNETECRGLEAQADEGQVRRQQEGHAQGA